MRFKCLSKQHGDAWKARLGALLAQVRGLLARRSASQNIQTNRTKLSARLYPPTRCAAVCASAHPAGMATQQTEQRRHDPLAETQGRLEDLCCRINPNEPQVGPRTALACAWERWPGWRALLKRSGWISRALSAWPSWVKSKKFRSTCLPGQRAIRPTSSAERFFAASAKAHFLSQIRLDNHRLDAPCIVQFIKFEQFIARYPHP